eukprot:CAMPEP_0117447154 /NCGR_PEP_ID=MMETSP0759-20121206/6724_1 /TAXON_ID=63605 /ORGANISM="Percolomonas cosmopolitus, Strain WS" /LENGTH=86 /DNA_ID=CAMNT_0005239471 /DNA_START=386 /DNA_END=646 /DNA_ORIENTATION=+
MPCATISPATIGKTTPETDPTMGPPLAVPTIAPVDDNTVVEVFLHAYVRDLSVIVVVIASRGKESGLKFWEVLSPDDFGIMSGMMW